MACRPERNRGAGIAERRSGRLVDWLGRLVRRLIPTRDPDLAETILAQTGELIRVVDREGRIEFLNAALAARLGCPPGKLLGVSLFDLLEEDGGEGDVDAVALEQALGREHPLRGRIHSRFPGGERLHEDWEVRPLVDADGTARRFLITGRELGARGGERRCPHHLLQLPQEGVHCELERNLERAGIGLVTTDDHGMVRSSNQAARTMLVGGADLPESPALWSHVLTTLDPENGFPLLSARDPIRRALRGEAVENAEVEVATSVGQRRLKINGGSSPEPSGADRALVVLQDITEFRGTMDALAASEARFRGMTANLPGAVFEVWAGQDGFPRFRFLSEGAKELFERPSQAIVAEPGVFSSLLDVRDSERFTETMHHSAQTGTVWNWEGRLRFGQRRVKWINWRAIPRPEQDGPVWYGVALNITESREATDELARMRDRLRELHASREEVQEAERKAIAREIHDELGSQLTVVKMNAASLVQQSEGLSERSREQVEAMSSLVDQAIETMRRVAAELRPRILDDFGIVAALKWRATDFERHSGIAIDLTTPVEESTVPPSLETTLYRVFQEALTNIAKHSAATQVDAVLEEREGRVVLCIRDNGVGFALESLDDSHHNGIFGMRERVIAHGGEFEINGAPDRGVVLCIRIPLARRE